MTKSAAEYRADWAGLDRNDVRDYLSRNSGLPGPRANLTLLDVAGDLLPESLIESFLADADEYLVCCATVALGRLVVPADAPAARLEELTRCAADQRWRVREAAAIAVQHVGDQDGARLREIVDGWLDSTDPLVIRAAIAAICEPRLLVDPTTAAAALTACERATRFLTNVEAAHRRDEDVRVLRQGLAYCWSVAVAGSPEQGLPRFRAIDGSDPDLAWVVKQNLTKQRLKRLL